ncbi:MAG TPA: glutamate formimidoyltransferase [Blastocatellia bacterium]|nr:glutamate formimidoyltransferase [Blastocatellia bacterium]
MNRIVECIANFSEGRRTEVVDAIVDAIRSANGAVILDKEMDSDHNRSVITFVAEPGVIVDAAVRATAKAAELIDLNVHKGEHPRLGATDVVPFVPIQGVTMDECVQLARQCGERIAAELKIPVYLYEKAATRPDRENLANIRKGEFEGVRAEIATNPARKPDFGDPVIHPTAGATVVGARMPLIAYNINLNTNNIEIANKIAKAVRHLSGGFRYVKALGFELKERGIVQVSMNLVNYEGTPIFRVFEAVKREAERYGINVIGSEIVGLVPQAALDMCADFFLQVENFNRDQILENRLRNALSELDREAKEVGGKLEASRPASLALTIGSFPELVASDAPTPGGGSVAALAGALAASLAQMVCRLTIGRKKYADVEPQAKAIFEELSPLTESLTRAIDEDAESFDRVMIAFKMPKNTDEEKSARAAAIEEATKGAAAVPMCTAETALRVLELLAKLSEIGNANAQSDVTVGAQMALTAVRGAYYNVATNLAGLKDEEFKREYRSRGQNLVNNALELASKIERNFLRETLGDVGK